MLVGNFRGDLSPVRDLEAKEQIFKKQGHKYMINWGRIVTV